MSIFYRWFTRDSDSHPLRAHQVNWMLLAPGAGLASAAMQTGDWSVAYQDEKAVVLRRKKLL